MARHLVAAGMLVDEQPEKALAHARFARQRASRIAVVREAAGIVAYHAGEWAEALGELRAARRMGGGPGHLAVMADVERALGRPERAIELTRSPEAKELGRSESIELAIVAAGARRDLGEVDVAVVGLQIPELDPARRDPWSARLFYAYADNLSAAGRDTEALQWFVYAADVDDDGATDAARRIAEITGEPLPDDDVEFDVEDAEPESPDALADTQGAQDGPAPGETPSAAESAMESTAAATVDATVDDDHPMAGHPSDRSVESETAGDDASLIEPAPADESPATVEAEPAVASTRTEEITPAADTAATDAAASSDAAAADTAAASDTDASGDPLPDAPAEIDTTPDPEPAGERDR